MEAQNGPFASGLQMFSGCQSSGVLNAQKLLQAACAPSKCLEAFDQDAEVSRKACLKNSEERVWSPGYMRLTRIRRIRDVSEPVGGAPYRQEMS